MPVSMINIFPKTHREEIQIIENGFQYEIKPFLISLKITGLHHLYWSETSKRKFRRTLGIAYRGFVPALLAINFLFSLGEFTNVHGFDGTTSNNLISSIWFLQVAMFSINNALRGWRWDRFYSSWNDYKKGYKVGDQVKTRKTAIIAVCCFIVWLLVASAFMAFSLSTPRPPSGFMVYIPSELSVLMMTFIIVAYFFFISTWFLMTSQFVVICIAICKLLEHLYQSIKKCLENRETFSEKVEKFRQQHDKICTMIDLADDILSIFVFLTVGTTIPLIVLNLDFVLFDTSKDQTFSYVATWWSISLSTIQLAAVFLFGGAVKFMAHKSCEQLYTLDLNQFSQTSISQLTVFLNRLTSQPIGLTAWGLFVLDKPTIITFVGSIATYAIVIIQFKPATGGSSVICNCTAA